MTIPPSSRTLSAQALDAALVDKQSARERAARHFEQAGGDPARAELMEEVASQQALRERVLAAVVREMGLAAPAEGSPAQDTLADRLLHAVNAHSLARVEFFSLAVRERLYQAIFDSENDSGTFGKEWRREILLHGKKGLIDENDAQLWERIVISVPFDYLIGDDGVWLGEHEKDFLASLSSDEAMAVIRNVIDTHFEDDLVDALVALEQRFASHMLACPFEHLLEDWRAPPTTSPRG